VATSPRSVSRGTSAPAAGSVPLPDAGTCSCCGQPDVDTVHLFSHRDVAVCFRCLDWLCAQRDRRIEARGGGWLALAVEPDFSVRDLDRAADHYVRLGFTESHRDATGVVVSSDRGVRIHLTLTEWAGRAGHGAIYLVVPDADEVAAAWRLAGVEVVGPYDVGGRRQGAHTDPDGNLIRFASAFPVEPR